LRGLEPGKSNQILDYVNNKNYGVVTGPIPRLNVEFKESLLLEATPLR
jgi:hypothetical protein